MSLIDELDATFREVDHLREQWEQAQVYECALTRIRYLTPTFTLLVEDVRLARTSLPGEMWLYLRTTLLREHSNEIETVGHTLTAGDEQFMHLVSYAGFVQGALSTIGELARLGEPTLSAD